MSSHRLGDFTVDPVAGEVVGPGGRERLDPKVMQVLMLLAQQAGRVVTRQELLDRLWPGVVVGDDVVSRCIYQLRRHLRQAGGDERHAAMVETLPKRGYRLNCADPNTASAVPGAVPETMHADRTFAPPESIRRHTRGRLMLAGAAAIALATAVAGSALFRRDQPWRNPLADARFSRVTDLEGVLPGVAISRDGEQMAFLARVDGRVDAWIGQAGTGRFRNLTQGRVPDIDNPARSLGFTPDASQVTTWTRILEPDGTQSIRTWVLPAAGGQPQPYVVESASEVDWSPDGTRLVYHPAAPGDPLFVANLDGTGSRQIHVAPYGVHCHFPVWSRDGRSIYFVQGQPPDRMDLWRVAVDGGKPERVTTHDSRVSYPVFLDDTTLLYLATAEDGTGPWLHVLDTRGGGVHRIAAGLEQYTSLAASADGRRLVATRTTPKTSLWRVPVLPRVATEADAERIALPASGGRMPRLGAGYLLFVSPGDGSGLSRLAARDGEVTEIWHGGESRLVAGPAIDPGSQRIAFSTARGGRTRLQVMNADGSELRTLAPGLEVEGAPAWSPGGDAIIVAAGRDSGTRLFEVPLDGAPVVPVTADYSRDAAWTPDGRYLLYNGAEVGPQFHVRARSADGLPRTLPDIALPRGARRLVVLPDGNGLVVLKGDARDRNFWRVDLDTGAQRQLTDFASGFAIESFDVSADGREIVFDQLREDSDVVRIDLARR